MSFATVRAIEKNLIVIGDKQTGKSSLVALLKSQTEADSKSSPLGVRHDWMTLSPNSQQSTVSTFKLSHEDVGCLEHIDKANPDFLMNSIVLIVLELSKASL